ncbi:MAG: hypothetical protein HeimC2_31470 [Candidatus Heimdallarchaeota archaeon LC_2]|nr:MAG: hypothetical protein HeimC2_31470 [Candidatus Heimdallarchaeota archaeon LC_2]
MRGIEVTGLSISNTALKIVVPNDVSNKKLNRFEEAVFHVISNQLGSHINSIDEKSILDNISSSRKIDLKRILQLVEEIANPIYLHKGDVQKNIDERSSLFIDGLAPDIAWKLQLLLDIWHEDDPSLFPKIKLRIYNMRLQFQNKYLSMLHEFFESQFDFDRILSLKTLFSSKEREELYADEITISVFKNHLGIYLKKDLDGLDKINFVQPDWESRNGYGILVSDQNALDLICDLIKPKIITIIDAILNRAEELGFEQVLSSEVRDNFINNFAISPQVIIDDFTYLQEQVEDLFLRKLPTAKINPDSISTDFDVLHYFRTLADSNISLEEILTTSTKFIHHSDIQEDQSIDKRNEGREMFELAKSSGKPIIRTRYFLNHPEKFFIRTLDLSNIRLVKQPDIRILIKLKHLKTLIFNNNRPSGEFDLSRFEFGKIPNLEIIYLKNCGLNALTSKMFTGGTKLRIIHVEGNPIRQIEDNCFVGMEIKELHLERPDNQVYSEDIRRLLEMTEINKEMRQKRIIDTMTS